MNVEDAAAHEMDTRFTLALLAAATDAARDTIAQDADGGPEWIVSDAGYRYRRVEL